MKKYLIQGFIVSFFLVISALMPIPTAAEVAPSGTDADLNRPGRDEVEFASFENLEEAEGLVQRMRESGFEPVIREVTTGEKTVYKVFVILSDAPAGEGHLPSRGGIERGGTELIEDRPVGTLKMSGGDIFGRAGYLHSALSLTGVYTDNAYNTATDRVSDFSTILSPEIWLSLPRVKQKPLGIGDTSTRTPSGFIVSRVRPDMLRRYQTHLHYLADIPVTSDNAPSGDTVTHKATGSLVYSGNKISADLVDQFLRSYEARGTGVPTRPNQVDRFINNIFNTIISFDTGNRFRFRVDYTNFFLDYDDDRNDFRNRVDNSFSGYLFYKVKPKTSLFAQYTFIDIEYEQNSRLNSQEHHFLGGLEWDVTAKSKGRVKAGYGIKDFGSTGERVNNFIVETQIRHRFTPKTNLTLTAYRKTDETNISTTSYILTNGVRLDYLQMLTSKITGLITLMYVNDKYKDDLIVDGTGISLEDDVYQAGAGLQYVFNRWLKSDIGYVYNRRDSSYSPFSYTSNTVFLRVTGSF
jgi:hypothetical protein